MRTITKALAFAVVALAAPAPALAADVPITFDNAVLDTPATPDAVVVDPSGPPVKAVAAVADDGSFTVAPATFDFPQYTFSSPVSGTIDVILNSPATGMIDLATGQVTMNADFEAQVKVTGFGDCNIDTGPVVLSTENKDPLPGSRFPAGAGAIGTGPGALAVAWESLPPGTGAGCALINPFVGGRGGFWISKGIAPKPPSYAVAKLKLTVKTPKVTVRSGGKGKFVVIVSNPSDTAATKGRFCVRNPRFTKKSCLSLGTIAAGAKKKVVYSVPAPTVKKKKTFTVPFSANATGVGSGKASAKLVVKPPA
jgi:hypothetical protein